MTLEEFGGALRARREARGLSVEDVVSQLKITAAHIGAMEAGDLSAMPHLTYARGFLRTYARFLGVPAADLDAALASLGPTQSTVTRRVMEPDASARPRMDTRWVGIVLSLVVAVAIGWAIWHFGLIDLITRDNGRSVRTTAPMQSRESAGAVNDLAKEAVPQRPDPSPAERRAPAQPVPAGQPGPDAGQPTPVPGPAAGQAPGQPAQAGLPPSSGVAGLPPQLQPRQPDAPIPDGLPGMGDPAQRTPGMPEGAGTAVSSGSPSQSLDNPGATRQPLPGVITAGSPWGTLQGNATLAGQAGFADEPAPRTNPNLPAGVEVPAQSAHAVIILAEASCWLQATTDTAAPRQQTLHAGDSLTLPFDTKLTLRLGNAGGVRVIYDGQEVESGKKGQVRTMTFPPAPPAQAPAAPQLR